jgi:pyruvate dehydrogenase E2 component (dihydrolipoamide acetyltransferase)
MDALREIAVPDIGEFSDVPVTEILVAVGDTVAVEDPLVAIESDKATMEIPAPFAGVVREILLAVGDKVSEGAPILKLEADGEGGPVALEPDDAQEGSDPQALADAPVEPAESPAPAEEAEVSPSVSPPQASPASGDAPAQEEKIPSAGGSQVYAGPAVRRAARERQIDLATVRGTGRRGRITLEDLDRGPSAVSSAVSGLDSLGLAPWPSLDFSEFGETERIPLTKIQQLAGASLARNWVRIPHVTHNEDADITELEAFRRQLNAEQSEVKVTMVALLLKAAAAALKAHPRFNSSLDGEELVLKRYYHLGFAADTPRGLLAPVVRDVDRKGILELAAELTELSAKARAGRISPSEMSGATFTISSLGGIGGTSFTPIVNAPEVAILGVVRAAMKPVWDGEQFQPRLMLPLSLSYDHRVIDGAAAARFCAELAQILTDMRRVLL